MIARCPEDGRALLQRPVHEQHPGDPHLGQVFGGKYLVVDVLGVGGFGAVYRAIQEPVGREVALKVIRADAPAQAEQMRARFFREAKAIGHLRHHASVSLHDYGEEDGVLYMVMEYVRGRTLKEALREERRFEPARTVTIVSQILEALAEAHEAGLVHRDLKPENIMLVAAPFGDEKVKVLDFGIAKVLRGEHDGGDTVQTREGLVIGTPRYMAPEQAHGRPVAQSDLYALGIILYQMLLGQVPFSGETPYEILKAHEMAPLPPFDPGAGVPAPLAAVICKALEKDPASRFPTAGDMALALRASVGLPGMSSDSLPPVAARAPTSDGDDSIPFLTGTSIEMLGESIPESDATPRPESRARLLAAAALGLLAVGGIAAWFAFGRHSGDAREIAAARSTGQRAAVLGRPGPESAEIEGQIASPLPTADSLYNDARRAAESGGGSQAAGLLDQALVAAREPGLVRRRAADDPAFAPHRSLPPMVALLGPAPAAESSADAAVPPVPAAKPATATKPRWWPKPHQQAEPPATAPRPTPAQPPRKEEGAFKVRRL